MPQPALELADIFRQQGPGYRARHRLPVEHLKVMRAVETCRTAVLGGHVERCGQCRCGQCALERIAYNSCRNRDCPKCQTRVSRLGCPDSGVQTRAKEQWLQRRKEELWPIAYFYVVFTVPPAIAEIALQNNENGESSFNRIKHLH